jgi:hypothetical protein
MAARSWIGSSGAAVGLAAGAGAAQLGVGYGLGIVTWLPADTQTGKVAWLASLAWVVWIAATSTVIGAITAHWLFGRRMPGERDGLPQIAWRATLTLAAAIGALVIVPLVAVPARAADSPENFAPEWTAAGYAVVGVIAGLFVAMAALSARPIAANVLASVGYLWGLAILAVADGLREGANPALAQLAIWEFSRGPRVRDFYVPGVLIMLGSAFVIGLLAAWPAGRRGENRIGVAISGALGPLVVAAAYLLAAPQFAGENDVDISQWSAYLFAPYAVISGLAGSVLVAAIGQRETPEEKRARLARAAEEREAREAERREAAFAAADRELDADRAASADETTRPVPVSEAPPTDDELADWPAAIGRTPSGGSLSGLRKPPAGDPDRPTRAGRDVPAHPDADLDEDAYAPARAYRGRGTDPDPKAYASDTVEDDPSPAPPAGSGGSSGSAGASGAGSGTPGASGASGRARKPLWPGRSAEADGSGEDGQSSGRGRGRR